ncbi:uracil permease, partial [Streptococcus pyogenes]
MQVSEHEERTALDLDVSTVELLLDVDEKPEFGKGLLLSFQHVFAMFGATILV